MKQETIMLKTYIDVKNEYVNSTTELFPGMAVKRNAAGLLIVDPEGVGVLTIVTEDEFSGKTIRDSYPAGVGVNTWNANTGDMAAMRAANGTTFNRGDLISIENGLVRVGTANIIGVADEAVVTSADNPFVAVVIK